LRALATLRGWAGASRTGDVGATSGSAWRGPGPSPTADDDEEDEDAPKPATTADDSGLGPPAGEKMPRRSRTGDGELWASSAMGDSAACRCVVRTVAGRPPAAARKAAGVGGTTSFSASRMASVLVPSWLRISEKRSMVAKLLTARRRNETRSCRTIDPQPARRNAAPGSQRRRRHSNSVPAPAV